MGNVVAGGLRMVLVLTLLTGLAYPLAMTGIAQAIFPSQANGSLVYNKEKEPIGSGLIGQAFRSPAYFHGRPSNAGADGYDGTSSGASNYGPTNQKLIAAAADNVQAVRDDNALTASAAIPADLVLASASGLDPHISPAAAQLQAARVAKERGLPLEKVRALIERHSETPQFGLFGAERVNVLALNIALDSLGEGQ